MHIAVDVGNTTIAFALVNNNKIIAVKRIDTHAKGDLFKLQLAGVLRGFKRRYGKINQAIVCSVVPRVVGVIKKGIKAELGANVFVVGEDIKVAMVNRYRNPHQVGQDRLVGAYAAMMLYGSPSIVIDLGTAITFDAVSAKGEYLGGAIVPGIRLSAESLFLKTALLPEIDITAPKNVIGRTTQESILSGLFYGYGSLCSGFIDLIGHQIKGRPSVIMTGGHTQLMKRFIKGLPSLQRKAKAPDFIDHSTWRFDIKKKKAKSCGLRLIDEHLVFKGLSLLLLDQKG
jgi:type III pantothenate kinase